MSTKDFFWGYGGKAEHVYKAPQKIAGLFWGRAEGDGGVPKKIFWAERREELRLELIEPSGASYVEDRQHTRCFPHEIRKNA